MLDIFNIPGQQDNVKIFYAAGTTAWQTWQKPRNCKFIWIMCIGGGAGGNSGGGNNSTNVSGGGSGGSGAITRALFPANILPDTLYIQPGPGGLGATGGIGSTAIQGNAGNISFVSIVPSSATVMNLICTSGTAAANPATVAGANGTGESAASVGNAGLLSLGSFISTGGAQATLAVDVTPFSNTLTCQGAVGGANTNNNNTTILATAISPQLVSGSSGVFSWKPFFSLGGAGGVGSSSGAGTNGGNGAYGSGGGGGGAGFTSFNGGSGGKGGDGLVIIATF
jgi:hypothetical protein